MDPDDALKIRVGTAHLVSGLPREQRGQLRNLSTVLTDAENDPARRTFLEEFPEAFGPNETRWPVEFTPTEPLGGLTPAPGARAHSALDK